MYILPLTFLEGDGKVKTSELIGSKSSWNFVCSMNNFVCGNLKQEKEN
jgi:hypothetical protein